MCVIMLATDTRPTDEMIEKAWEANDDGAGIAWRDGKEGSETVNWIKGIEDVEEIKKLCKELPMTYVVHFRIASVGGIKQSLTHPFIISKASPLMLKGSTKGCVLFHNGHWSNWHEKAMDAAIHANAIVPGGDWSDSRAMAWMSHLYGPNFMELLPNQKGIIMSPKGLNIYTGNGWNQINNVWCSNDGFWTRKAHTRQFFGNRLCNVGRCTRSAQAGKDMCQECEHRTTHNAPAPINGNAAGALVVKPPTTGGTGNSLPFEITGLITMKQADTLHRRGDISKSLLKKFRREHQAMESKGPKALKAKAKLESYTKAVLQKFSVGRLV